MSLNSHRFTSVSRTLALNVALTVTLIGAASVSTAAPATGADDAKSERRSVNLRILGGEKKVPLAEVEILITNGHGESQKKFGPYRLDAAGTCKVSLPKGFYSLHLKSEKEWPYLPVEELWNKRSRTSRPDLGLNITDSGAEKWLDGKRRDDGYEKPADPADSPRITYMLLAACELVLRAVDADTGKGLPGATFYMENALGEDWGHAIDGENLGAKLPSAKKPADRDAYFTGKNGVFKRLVGANANYKYGVEVAPAGYELTEPRSEVDIDVKYGQTRAEQVFKFRRVR